METAVATAPEAENNEKLYRFDQTEFDITFNARPMAPKPAPITHKLRRPTLDELMQWQRAATYESIQVSKRESEIKVDSEAANIALWRKIIVAVKGYDFGDGRPIGEFRSLSDDQKDQLSAAHKIAAVRGLHSSACEIDYEDAEDASVMVANQTWRVKQSIRGDAFTVIHTLREPSEAERRKFNQNASSTSHLTGARKPRSTVKTNLKAYIALYDALILDVEGGQVGPDAVLIDANRKAFLAQIDPILKQDVVQTLMAELDGSLQD